MPSIFTLEGTKAKPEIGACKCTRANPKTGKRMQLCYVGQKPGKRGSGWQIKGPCDGTETLSGSGRKRKRT